MEARNFQNSLRNKYMKQIKIKEITLRNWRGEKERTTRFNLEAPTSICGDNGLGKSRHFDAFCWLLFGKDSQDRKDFELRSYDEQHNVLHRCECSVEAILIVDREELTLKREYKEQWVKPRGQVEEVFSGNVTECIWNGVPIKVSEFKTRVSKNIIDETVFKMITNPRYFTEKMKWQLQREQLLQIAGVKSDEEIASNNEDFKKLLDELNGKSLSDFRKEISSTKKRLKTELSEIQPRIDQTQKMMPEAEDWNALQSEIDKAEKDIATLTEQVTSIEKRNEAELEKDKQTAKDIHDLEMQRIKLEQDELSRMRNEADTANEERRQIERKIKEAHERLTQVSIERKQAETRRTHLKQQVTDIEVKLNSLREKWRTINGSEYNGSDICSCCGQRLPENKITEAHNIFAQNKAEQLRANNNEGKSLVTQRDLLTEELSTIEADEKFAETIKGIELNISELYQQLDSHPLVQAPTSLEVPTNEMKDLDLKVKELRELLNKAEVGENPVVQIEKERDALYDSLTNLKTRMSHRSTIDKAMGEIAALENRGRELAQQIAELEKREYTAVSFIKKRIEDCEQRVNTMFKSVRFQLFDYTQEGNEFEVCIPIVNGTPYGVTNTAGQVNAGLDIINTLCQFYNIYAPVFIDGAESVNHYMSIQSQMILLQVTQDKQLVIK